jgi:hypothetical protein
MELPDDILKIIKEYSQPLTRPDWEEGCFFNRRRYKINNKYYSFKYLLLLTHKIYISTVAELYINMMLTELMMAITESE